LLPNKWLKRQEEGVSTIDEAIKKTGYTIGYPGWCLLYYSVLCSLRKNAFNNIVETGTNLGCSTIILAQALIDSQFEGCIYSVEKETEIYDEAVNNIKFAEVDHYVKLYNDDSIAFLSGLNLENNIISYAFLDGCHDQKHVFNEFGLIFPYLDNKSCVAFDNTFLISENKSNKRVNGALELIKKEYGGNLVNFENVSWYTPGFAIWQKDPFLSDWLLDNEKS
jgi:predicted O-methyltransferase YrrM